MYRPSVETVERLRARGCLSIAAVAGWLEQRYDEDQPRDELGRFGGGGGDDDDDDSTTPIRDASILASTQIGDQHVRVVDDPDGTLNEPSYDPATFVEITESSGYDPGEGMLLSSGGARDLAGTIDAAAGQASMVSPPPHPDDLDEPRPEAYEDGPAEIGGAGGPGFTVIAYYDAYGDTGAEGTTKLYIGETSATSPPMSWDANYDLTVDLGDAADFSAALRDMADRADAAAANNRSAARRFR